MTVFDFLRTGYTKMYIDFITYINEFDLKATGIRCDNNGTRDYCDLVLELCISRLGNR